MLRSFIIQHSTFIIPLLLCLFYLFILSFFNFNPMKNYISYTILLIALLIGMVTGAQGASSGFADPQSVKVENRQTATATVIQEMGMVQVQAEKQGLGGFLSVNWGILSLSLLSFLEVVTRLTPSEKDNTVLTFLSNILNAVIPNLKKGGGRL